ncbi:hypothetical protein CGH72_24080 [Vibrio parahaemolyticus]|uniref:hypothetical protein n=1 Tax=Vibrio parahaemolyticus TaxID=670 RepID=UPI0011208E74|nr:hypothetical protein [Vibrio parahaemolyticus]MBE3782246.1 hypothetical protein [Vibrio parahaemolyticus]TOB48891.1 hypothetical protein CGK05_23335 [Vibrio parahaemolyticus]TOM65582.1 hypothetical protein CGH72_24080 [Vibrio parahaemolyticus]TOM67236.1 hypothetical protein CGH73_12895 [Vibrio parahaemolyticus]TOO76995.1 hypothetical protein CGH29_26205 [Vibrio parahaemolyticus]
MSKSRSTLGGLVSRLNYVTKPKSGANWYVCGDIGPEMPAAFSDKHLTSTFGLVLKVRVLKLA